MPSRVWAARIISRVFHCFANLLNVEYDLVRRASVPPARNPTIREIPARWDRHEIAHRLTTNRVRIEILLADLHH